MERVGIHLNSRPSRELASPYLAGKVYPRDHHRNPPYPKSRPPRGAAVGAGNRKGGKEATSFGVAKKMRGGGATAILAPHGSLILLSLNADGCIVTHVSNQMIRLHPSLPNTIDLYIQLVARCVHYSFYSSQLHCVECP